MFWNAVLKDKDNERYFNVSFRHIVFIARSREAHLAAREGKGKLLKCSSLLMEFIFGS